MESYGLTGMPALAVMKAAVFDSGHKPILSDICIDDAGV